MNETFRDKATMILLNICKFSFASITFLYKSVTRYSNRSKMALYSYKIGGNLGPLEQFSTYLKLSVIISYTLSLSESE